MQLKEVREAVWASLRRFGEEHAKDLSVLPICRNAVRDETIRVLSGTPAGQDANGKTSRRVNSVLNGVTTDQLAHVIRTGGGRPN